MAEREYYPKPKAPEPAVADAHPRGPKVMGQDKPDKKPDTAWRDAMANTPGEQIVEADTGGGQIVEAYKSGGLWRLKGSPRGSTDTIRVIRWRPKV